MALDTLGVVSNEYRKRLLLRNLVNSDDPSRLFNLGLAMLLPQQYTTQMSDSRQFVATAISIKNLIDNTFMGGGGGTSDNSSTRAFIQQDYTYDKPYAGGEVPGLTNAADEITENPPAQRQTYNISKYDKALKINGAGTGSQNIPDNQKLKQTTSTNSNISQFYWKKDDQFEIGDKKDLLSFTQSILSNYKSSSIGKVIDQSQSRYQKPDGTGDYTKGSNVKDIEDPQKLAREFTVEEPYNKISDLLRHEKPYMMEDGKSSLGENGFARIAPNKSERNKEGISPKNLMFSIENLAWDGQTSQLPCLEVGDGTKEPNGPKGRIMWFPPYGITITDNSTVNWQSTSFVGRGEPIYTYNNTERSMTLQFKVIVDHPSVLNAVKNQSRISVDQFFSATGGKLESTIKKTLGLKYERLGEEQKDKAEVQIIKNGKIVSVGSVESSFSVPNDVNFTCLYSADTFNFLDNATGNTQNDKFNLTSFIDKLYEVIDKVVIHLNGSSSINYTIPAHCGGPGDTIADLGEERILNFVLYIKSALAAKVTDDKLKENAIDNIENIIIWKTSEETASNCNFEWWQSLSIKVKYDPSKDKSLKIDPGKKADLSPSSGLFLSRKSVPLCESDYFDAMNPDTQFALFENLKDRLKYFDPAFHSMTPEGFNSRLTFLLQCTRQGPSINVEPVNTKTNRPTNSAFGRPPVCILRIGDFYYTKVVIDSVNISYDDNLWDLNPEGIGIQPMIATVDLNMKVIGGSSLEGPILRLQNALSYHFFANTEVYQAIPEKKIIPVAEDPPVIEELPLDVDPNPEPEAKEVTLPGISGITSVLWVMDGLTLQKRGIEQDKDVLLSNNFKTIVTTKFSLDRAVISTDNEGKGYVEVQAVILGAFGANTSKVQKINVGDPYTDIEIEIVGVNLPMVNELAQQPISSRIHLVSKPGEFKVSRQIYIPSQSIFTGYDFGDTSVPFNFGPVDNTDAPSWIQNPYCGEYQYLINISRGATSYWCPCECNTDGQWCGNGRGHFNKRHGNCYERAVED